MKFKHGTRRRALEYEKDWVQRWKQDRTFEKSVENRPASDAYVFYDGPPFITGVPHHGTLLSSIVKDAVPRYWTMKGKRVERRWGWDCHGLPAENFVEKQLGIVDRRQIVAREDDKAPLDKDGSELPKITLEEYITKARESMVANSATWQGVIDRIGRWVDFEGAYRTMDKNFMESVWWAFKKLYDAGKIYEGEKVLMYDTKFATPVSKNEVTMDNDAYQTVTDPSLYAKFRLKNKQNSRNLTLSKDAKILFVCNANAARSQMAQGLYNHYSNSQIAESAGLNPEKQWIEAPTLVEFENLSNKPAKSSETMQEIGVDISEHKRRLMTPDNLGDYELIVNLAEKVQTPAWLKGDNVVWWNVTDPRNESVEKNRIARDEIKVRVEKLLNGEVVDDTDADVVSVLAWTTTPWTLPANLMLAVSPELTYCEVAVEGEKFIVAEEALERVFQDEKHQPIAYEVLRKFPGSELVGKSYKPIDTGSTWPESDKIHKIYAADFVSHESGTGIVHIAPAYGEDDFELGKANGVAAFHVIDDNGYYTDSNYKGLEVWENNKRIAKDLIERGQAWKIEYIRHEYPFNPRSKQRIMYRAIPSWFFDIQGSKPLMLEQNENVNWFPAHLKHGRFAKNIEQAPDWNLSRDRFWATAFPVWKGDKGSVKVVGSYAELRDLSGVELEDYHRPWVDDITFEIDGEKFTRIDKVLDCWFESGSMPFAQFHYPFENKEKFEANFPGDFIVEYVGQVRAWFYYVHAVNTALADIGAFGKCETKNAFKNVITTGVVAGNDGRKMSKSLGNFTDPNELMDKFSADSLRFLLLSSPLLNGEDFALHDKDVGDVARKLSMVWNMYDFFTMYAEVDGWEFDGKLVDPLTGKTISSETASRPTSLEYASGSDGAADVSSETVSPVSNPLDKWIISRVHQLTAEVEKYMDAYNIPDALSPILPFLDDASNWFVRRSRRRFWRSEDDGDKNDAYRTLHYVLVRLSYILAPFTPFLAEELYHNLTGDDESIHLKDWLPAGEIDEQIVAEMAEVREYINEGLSLRAKAGLKVRQPLASVTVPKNGQNFDYTPILLDELNVKEVKYGGEVAIDENLTSELKREGLMREVIRHVQAARKKAGLQVDDRITLTLKTEDNELGQAIQEHSQTIAAETLATFGETSDNPATVKVEGAELQIALSK